MYSTYLLQLLDLFPKVGRNSLKPHSTEHYSDLSFVSDIDGFYLLHLKNLALRCAFPGQQEKKQPDVIFPSPAHSGPMLAIPLSFVAAELLQCQQLCSHTGAIYMRSSMRCCQEETSAGLWLNFSIFSLYGELTWVPCSLCVCQHLPRLCIHTEAGASFQLCCLHRYATVFHPDS